MSKTAIKIVYLVSTLGRSGPTRQLYYILKYLDRGVFDPYLVTLSAPPKQHLEELFQDLGVDISRMETSRLGSMASGTAALKRLLCRIQPDLVHSSGLRSDWLSSQLEHPTTRIATQRNDPVVDYPLLFGPLKGTLAAWVHKRALKKMPFVVYCSHFLEESARTEPKGNQQTCVIQNGVEIASEPREATETMKRAWRRDLGLEPSGHVFIYTGPLIKRKNVEFLIDAFKTEALSKNTLVVVGAGPLFDDFFGQTKHSRNITLLGERDDISRHLALADCYISASTSEGLSNSVLEAMACGLPALLSDIPSHREVLRGHPRAGAFFSLNDRSNLIAAISAVTKDQTQREAARRCAEGFSAKTMSAQYQDFYRELLSNIT